MLQEVAVVAKASLYKMNTTLRQKALVELMGIGITALIAGGILYPIFQNFVQPFPFLESNIICIVLFLTYVRYIFLLKHSWFSHIFLIKMALMLLSFPLGMWLMYQNREFLQFADSELPDSLLTLMRTDKPETELVSIIKYIRAEYILFVTGAFLANVALFFRLLMSVWRGINRGSV